MCLTQCFVAYMKYAHSIDLTVWYGFFSCKLTFYIGYVLDAISPYLLVYISVEKYISITYQAKSSILRSKRNQLIFLTLLVTFNGLLYIEVPFYYDVIKQDLNFSNQTVTSVYKCTFLSYSEQLTSSYIDLVNRLMVPLALMVCFSSLLISAIFKSRRRVASSSSNENTQLKRDVRFAVTSFSMNLLFFILNMPVSLIYFFPDAIGSNIVYFSTFYFYFISYAINFYIMIGTNRLFRQEFFSLYTDLKANNSNQMNGITKTRKNNSMELTARNTRTRQTELRQEMSERV